MCGIAGIFAYSRATPDPSLRELETIRDHMARRGPDGAGTWTSSCRRTVLGHRRLSIIDLSDRALQPMASADGRLHIVFNGEIYNFAALQARLTAAGHKFRTRSDTEVLLTLYQEMGPAMVRELRGMFAFAIWDDERRGVFMARDPYGIKPLYYSLDGGALRFASQVKALLAGGHLSTEPDPAAIVGFYLFGNVPEPFTVARAIRSLGAGSTIWVDEQGARDENVYASVAEQLTVAGARPSSNDSASIRDALLDSVRHHLVADVEVGAFLSSGVDSGALVGLMRDAGQAKIQAITLGFQEFAGTASDETALAAEVARRYGCEHHVRHVSRHEFESDLPSILQAMDQPSIDGINSWFVSKAAREFGLKVAISGLGGDELLGGYSSFRDIPRWRRGAGWASHIPGAGLVWRTLGPRLAPGLARRNPKVFGLVEHAGSDAAAYLLKRALHLPAELPAFIDEDLARDGLARLAPIHIIGRTLPADPAPRDARVAAMESANYMRNQLLRDADWAGMAHSLEIRVPLVDFTLLGALAPILAGRRGEFGKRALALAPSLPLPDTVLNRPKTGFSVPTSAWASEQSASGENDRLASRGWARRVLSASVARSGLQPC